MSGFRISSLNVYRGSVHKGFRRDVEDFLDTFRQENSLNYVDFAKVWQKKNFTLIFADQDNINTLKILCETCFNQTKKYIKFHSNIHIKIGAFYLLYGLYYKQPIEGMYKIRLTLDEYRQINLLMKQMLPKGQYDVLYIYSKMLSDNAFVYVACPRALGLITYTDFNDENDIFECQKTDIVMKQFENLLRDQTIKELSETCTEYNEKFKKVAENYPGLVAFKSALIEDLRTAQQSVYDKVSNRIQTNKEATRVRLKRKAMKIANATYRGDKLVLTANEIKTKTTKQEKKETSISSSSSESDE